LRYTSDMGPIRNIHGRRGTRGLRPWLLIPKIIAITWLLGGLTAVAVLIFTSEPHTPAAWADLERALSHLYHWMVIPGAILAVTCGILLLTHHGWGLMLRQRWLKVKLAIALLTITGLHLTSRALLLDIRRELVAGEPDGPTGLLNALGVVSVIGLALLITVVVLGRIKPRLGQNWAREYPAEKKA
jgi:uncharacterized membrane protein